MDATASVESFAHTRELTTLQFEIWVFACSCWSALYLFGRLRFYAPVRKWVKFQGKKDKKLTHGINDVADERIKKGITISRRIRWAPLPLQTKASLIACLVGPTAMKSFPAGGFAFKLVSSFRTAVVAAHVGHETQKQMS